MECSYQIPGAFVSHNAMTTKIFHNPRCSKSRQTLKLLQDKGIQPEIITYLVHPPSADELLELSKLIGQPLATLVRTGEARAKELELNIAALDDPALAQVMSDNPILIERPIVVVGDRAVIGRPPENIEALFG